MFRALLAPLLFLDRFVQRRFDSTCFFLMRRYGVRKSMIRYALNALFITTLVVRTLSRASYGLLTTADIVFYPILVLVLLLIQRYEVAQDRAAESRPGTASKVDRYQELLWVWKGVGLSSIIDNVHALSHAPAEFLKAGLVDGQHRFSSWVSVVLWTTFLLLQYLYRTPMNPPPEKEAERSVMPKPAPAES